MLEKPLNVHGYSSSRTDAPPPVESSPGGPGAQPALTDYGVVREFLDAGCGSREARLAAIAALERMRADEQIFRCLLWAAQPDGKYGDDGELQCGLIDFKRMTAQEIGCALFRSRVIRASAAPGIPATVALAAEHEQPDIEPRNPQAFTERIA